MKQMASTARTSTEYVHEVTLSTDHQLQTVDEMNRQTMAFLKWLRICAKQ